jgi:hypothetical protein
MKKPTALVSPDGKTRVEQVTLEPEKGKKRTYLRIKSYGFSHDCTSPEHVRNLLGDQAYAELRPE